MKLLDSPFSPFARKVRMVLEHKGLAFDTIDALLKSNHDVLHAANSRLEVPALIDGDITVINSADIVAYLEHRYPQQPVYPEEPAERVTARAWERTADTLIDAALINVLLLSNEDSELLVTDDRIRLISFTGSAPVGWAIKDKAGKKKVVLELGGAHRHAAGRNARGRAGRDDARLRPAGA